jgi:ribosomal peptide maturation radical SAM protein 1
MAGKPSELRTKSLDVLFAVLPFAEVSTPVIAAGLLKAEVARAGFSSRVRYFNLDFAGRVGVERYRQVYDEFSARSLLGERIFAEVLFEGQLPRADEYGAKLAAEYPQHRRMIRELLKLRRHSGEFVEDCAEEILRLRPRVVAFTTTYQQTCACLAVAARLKQSSDPPVIAFGGANCEGEMGLQFIRSFPCVDYVCTGEGDLVFPEFLQQLLRGDDSRALAGLLKRGESTELTTPSMVGEMDSLPIPDYADYFEELRLRPGTADMDCVALLMQTSRGCWWGAKQHCTFCGLNDQTMSFRSKSPDAVLQELSYFTETYGARTIYCVDNILDLGYVRTLFPKLIERGSQVKLFYETKANLTFSQLVTLRDGGVRWIQPGIESFSNQVLHLMQKGTTGLKNIQLLRWCKELGIEALWNILYGFPGESPSEYVRMAKLIPLLAHLNPPGGCGAIRLDRFSPYFNRPDAFGLREVRAHSYYRYVFPLAKPDLDRLAYYFEFDWPQAPYPNEYTGSLRRVVRRWKALTDVLPRQRPRLDLRWTPQALFVNDTRPCAVRRRHRLTGLAAEIYLLCDTVKTVPSLVKDLGAGISGSNVRRILRSLGKARLLAEDDGHYLSLAVWRNRAKPSLQGMIAGGAGKIAEPFKQTSARTLDSPAKETFSRNGHHFEPERSNLHAKKTDEVFEGQQA